MKENNINQVAMEIEETEILEVTERKGIFARAKDKATGFGEKHPKVVKAVKGVGIGLLAVGAFALGKACAGEDETMEIIDVDVDFMPNEDVVSIETTEE